MVYSWNRYNSGIELRKVGILTIAGQISEKIVHLVKQA